MAEYSLRELECFLAVAEELSFTRAAERLRLAQPPLSRHIRSLEETLEVRLFDRSQRHVALTAAGIAFRDEARDILPRLRRAGEAAKRAAQGETDRVAVGFVSAVLSPELVDVFKRFRCQHPSIRMHLHDLLPSEQLDHLARGELDIAFVGVAPERIPAGLATTRWREEALLAFLPPGHRSAKKSSIRLRELAEEPFVMISATAAPAYTSFVNRLCLKEGFRPRIIEEAARAQAVAALTVAGVGVSILPTSLHRITGNGVVLKGAGSKGCSIIHSVLHSTRPSQSAVRFLSELRLA
jgi:DNA-binding transcriptional LysR family regulator